jgi:uncharacterized membrane protein YqjE
MSELRERSLGDLFAELSRDTSTLIRKEFELAQVEMSRKLSHAARQVAFLLVGAAVVYAGLLALVAGLVLILVRMGAAPSWAAALIVALAVLAIGGLLVGRSISALRAASLVPTKTIQSVRETTEWAKDQAR